MSIVTVHGPTMLGSGDGGQLEDLTLQSVVPDTMNATVATELHFHGTGFTSRSKVRIQSADYTSSHGVTFISEGELSLVLPIAALALTPGDWPVQIKEGFDVSNQTVILHILP